MAEGVCVAADVYTDLIAEGEDLDRLVAGLAPAQWAAPTPAPGWSIAHQVAHLASIAALAQTAATQPEVFGDRIARGGGDFDGAVQALLSPYLSLAPEELLHRWRADRAAATSALASLQPDQQVPWLARPLPAQLLASAGVMELVAHGQDIADAAGVSRDYTDRIKHAAVFALGNWDYAYQVRGLEPPAEPFRFELTAPSGAQWSSGPPDAAERVTGPATDFCLLTTRRRHRSDLRLTATGPQAERWLDIAQGYRGTPGPGRSPGQFAAQPPADATG
jgi:uncharacterized protein (TIGR03084 family)